MSETTRLNTEPNFWNKKKLPLVRQTETSECGLACIAMIAGFYGHKVDLTYLRRKFNLSIEGMNLHDVMRFSANLNMSSRVLKVEPSELSGLKHPCILHWDLNHFVVLKSVNKNKVTIYDPAKGESTYSLEQVSKYFTGYALELTPTESFKVQDARTPLKFSDFWSKITGLNRSIFLIISLSLLLQVFTLITPFYMQVTIDNVILNADYSLMKLLVLGFFLLLIFEILTNALRGLSILYLSSKMSAQLASNVFHHLIRLPVNYFEKRHLGDVLSRFSSLHRVKELLTTGVIEVVIDGLMAAITLCMLAFYNLHLTFIVLVAVALYLVARLAMYRSYKLVNEQEIICKANENTNFMESIRGIQTVKLFNAEVDRESTWNNLHIEAINQSIKLGKYNVSYIAINRFLFGVENLVVIYLAADLVIQGGFSTGMLFAYVAYKRQFMDKVAKLVDKVIAFKMLSLHFDRLSDIVLSSKETNQQLSEEESNLTGKLSLRNVTFRYSDTSSEVISNVNLDIEAGESVAIVGPSGSGKSTLIKLMLGLEHPSDGDIYIDDRKLSRLNNGFYRESVAAVMQQEELFSGTIEENITFFSSDYNSKLVKKCAQMAAIHEDIMKMPMQYNTLIGDMGTNLSGGQKQRLILARALYKKPKILFMDEATSHLDTELEARINSAIKELNITRVIVAHRKETINSASRVINLENLQSKID